MQAEADEAGAAVAAADEEVAGLRQRIQALPPDDSDVDAPANRAALGRAFAAAGRTARELRAKKLALGHGGCGRGGLGWAGLGWAGLGGAGRGGAERGFGP